MQIHTDIDYLPKFNKAVITIGTFDGVHAGHLQIIEKLKAEAQAIQGETVIVTFHPHPRKVVSSSILGIRLITTMPERLRLLEKTGIDHLVIVPFTEVFANMPAEDYVKNFLIEKFNPHSIIIGYDHQFGKGRTGNYRLLERLKDSFGYTLKEIPKHILENISISSTNIREAILYNDTKTCNMLLGYAFFFSGKVVNGDKLGRTLGYPTANLKIQDEEKIVPGNGIYTVKAELINYPETKAGLKDKYEGKIMSGMMSIGFRPTVAGTKKVIEVNIFDFDEDIYDCELRVHVIKFLREEIKFESLEKLVQQIDLDKIDSLKVLEAKASYTTING